VNVEINGILYEDVAWEEKVMTMETEMPLDEIERAFTPGETTDITVYDGGQKIAKYFNKGIDSIRVYGDPRTVEVVFNLTQIAKNAETEIRENLDTSDGAIVELAEIIGEMSEYDIGKMLEDIQSSQETINTWFANAAEIQQFINDLRKPGGILDMFDARIKALEQDVTITEEGQNNG